MRLETFAKQKIKKRSVLLSVLIAMLVFLPSCSVTKYVPDDQHLLDKVEINTKVPGMQKAELEKYLTQQPNFRVFGMARLRLATYSLSGRDTSKRRNRWLRRMGEEPVIFDSLHCLRSEKKLEQFFQTKGYLNAQVVASAHYKGKKARVVYDVTENEPYRLRHVSFDFHNDTTLGNLIRRNRFSSTLLDSGALFDMQVLNEERSRIANIARRNGYYYFTKDDVSYLADSSLRSNQVDLTLVLKPYYVRTGDIVQETQHPRFTINNINVTTLPKSSSILESYDRYDSLALGDNSMLFYVKKPLIRKKILNNNLRVFPGMWYNDFFVNATYNKLNGLGIVRSTEITFKDLKTESNQLDCNILILPNKAHTFSLDVEGTNSSGDLGAAVSGTLQHRNLFRGSELLSLKARGAWEMVTYKVEDISDLSKYVSEYEVDLSLKFPQFVFPFLSSAFKRRINSSTEFTFAINDQHRPEYVRDIMTAGMKYVWNMHRFYNYTIDAYNLNYVHLPWVSPEFNERYSASKYSVLRYSYSDHLIFATGVSMSYNNQNSKTTLNKQSYRISLESAGNLLYGIDHMLKSHKNEDGFYEVAHTPYSQYVKGEFEYAYNKYLDERNRIVTHLKFGLELPYGNSEMVPFEKRFFSGGANGVRGWPVRTLGPGSYHSPNGEDFVSQSGNIDMTANVEYRSKLFWLLEGAAFVDAGNVWNIRRYDFQPEGTFYFDTFYEQIALAYGLGIRCDFTYFLVRLDFGMKAYDPAREKDFRWRYKDITWGNDFAFHFAIGYPF